MGLLMSVARLLQKAVWTAAKAWIGIVISLLPDLFLIGIVIAAKPFVTCQQVFCFCAVSLQIMWAILIIFVFGHLIFIKYVNLMADFKLEI